MDYAVIGPISGMPHFVGTFEECESWMTRKKKSRAFSIERYDPIIHTKEDLKAAFQALQDPNCPPFETWYHEKFNTINTKK